MGDLGSEIDSFAKTRRRTVRPQAYGKVIHPKKPRLSQVAAAAFCIFMITLPATAPAIIGSPAGSASRADHLRVRVAVVKPVFTATAYSSFYGFYSKYANTPKGQQIRSDLEKLNATIVDGWGWSDGLRQFINSRAASRNGMVLGKSLTILTDISVTEGQLFDDKGVNRFDVVILGFTEYVTSQQYSGYKHFVENGGRLVFLDATNFLAEVKYHSHSHHLSLVMGHGWGFDGKKVWRDVFERWGEQNKNWIASNYCCGTYSRYDGAITNGTHPISLALKEHFGSRVFKTYGGHEENQVTNMTGTTILARWVQASPGQHDLVAAYLHRYLNGTVIHIGVMGSDVISFDQSVQFFLIRSVLEPN
ncbi:MAG TPA: N,N-dimethylformamidase beta subunit family domain-containing protein [Candidatus Bathyarchaeia archaeon]|nr:N,N-dimethylformamidase beta subunit family domain-containing protein [Candidatus Bathyarchaeia archaeon]